MRTSLALRGAACAMAALGTSRTAPHLVSAQTQVHVVATAAGPGVDFTDPQAAIDAASPGDIVLLKPVASTAEYFAPPPSGVFAIAGKPVHLVGDVAVWPQTCGLAAPLRVSSIPSGADVAVLGCSVRPPPTAAALASACFEGDACAGGLWLQQVVALPADSAEMDGMLLDACANAVMVQSDAIATGPALASRHGVRSRVSVLSAFEGVFLGANGQDHPAASTPVAGGDAMRIDGGKGVLFPAQANGGKGGSSLAGAASCTNGADGGAGLRLLGQAAVAGLLYHHSEGGSPGSAPAPCLPGTPGALYQIDSGTLTIASTLTEWTGWSSHVAREGQSLTLVTGYPGTPPGTALLAVASQPGYTEFGKVPILVGAGAQVFDLGPVGGGFLTTLTVVVGELGPGVEGAILYTQLAVVKADGQILVGSPWALALLDASL